MLVTSEGVGVLFKVVIWDELIPLCERIKYKVIAFVVYVSCGMCSTLECFK